MKRTPTFRSPYRHREKDENGEWISGTKEVSPSPWESKGPGRGKRMIRAKEFRKANTKRRRGKVGCR